MKMDALTRRVLGAHAADPSASHEALAEELGVEVAVVTERIARLTRDNVLQGMDARIDATQVGYPYEAFILAVPSSQTTRRDLEQLAASPLVTRMFTLATRRSIAFTVLGKDPDSVCQYGEELAQTAHLQDVAAVMLVDTMADNPGAALCGALAAKPIGRPISTGEPAEEVIVGSQEVA